MKRIWLFLATVIFLGIIIGSVILAPNNKKSEAQVAATIFPIYDIARNIAGDELEVALILPPGASPHTFEITPSALRQLSSVETVYAVGHGLDDWTNQISKSIDAEVVVVDKNINLRESGDDHSEIDPHYYLTIENAMNIAITISTDLATRYPELADNFQTNLTVYLTELAEVNPEIERIIDSTQNKNIITLHDAWYYFAEEYGLNIVGTFEPSAGREPTPQYLVELTKAIETSGASMLFSEPQLSTESINQFVSDNGLSIIELDPIGGVDDRDTYIKLMLSNAEAISKNQ